MIHGVVNENLEAAVPLRIRRSATYELDVEAVIDSGFNGFLTVAPEVIESLTLPRIGKSRVLSASGKEEILDLYEVDILWDGTWRTVEAEAADTVTLVGMSLLQGYNLSIEAVVSGRIKIEILP